jgi:Fe-S oxidoreductase
VKLLEDAGFAVEIPRAPLCCGRPLYDYGMLSLAKQRLREVVDALFREIDEGIPIVVLEPSCVAVFRDELRDLLPEDPRARRLTTLVSSLGEFLSKHEDRLPPMTLRCKALVHGHCHQKALFGMEADRHVFDRLGLDYEIVDSGCCGMAGSFGFERDHYDISQAVGEQRLLPRVRQAADDVLIVADGFSCREQIAQATNRRALHLADVLALARHRDAKADQFTTESREGLPLRRIAAVLALAAGAASARQIVRAQGKTIR